jgi:hypothetical protein
MRNTQIRWLSLTEIRERLKTHSLLRAEVPIEHYISIPLPTKRWAGPAYACFASPASRRPGQPVVQGAPDRWWVMSAHGGSLIIYALWDVFPYAEVAGWTTVTLPPVTRSIAEQQQDMASIELLMNTLAPAFFGGESSDTRTRKALLEALAAHLPEPLLPQYRALAPDFFAWLEE